MAATRYVLTRRSWRFRILIWIFAALLRTPWAFATGASAPPRPQDSFMYFGASVGSRASWPTSSAWGLEFRQVDGSHFAWSFAYINDGHFPRHHRDGVSGEAWVPFTFAHRMTLSVGAGPFYYFDTEHAIARPDGYADVHGWAWLLSADMRVALWSDVEQPGWFVDLRYDWSAPAKDIETHSIGLGIGYRMYSDFASGTPTLGTVTGFAQNEIVGYIGKTVVNSFSSQWSFAEALEYRRELAAQVLRGSLTFVNEGNAQLIRRKGLLYEVWAEPSFWDGNASVGIGWGGYTAVDKSRPTAGRHVSYVVSVTLSARFPNLVPMWQSTAFAERTDVRVTWHRIVTDYDRDTDILLFGLGYRF
ncbi:MAG TPA: hypothetical protein VIC29_16495 [Steroidobacteraceae bacterium]|jgi:hypothetical protein